MQAGDVVRKRAEARKCSLEHGRDYVVASVQPSGGIRLEGGSGAHPEGELEVVTPVEAVKATEILDDDPTPGQLYGVKPDGTLGWMDAPAPAPDDGWWDVGDVTQVYTRKATWTDAQLEALGLEQRVQLRRKQP